MAEQGGSGTYQWLLYCLELRELLAVLWDLQRPGILDRAISLMSRVDKGSCAHTWWTAQLCCPNSSSACTNSRHTEGDKQTARWGQKWIIKHCHNRIVCKYAKPSHVVVECRIGPHQVILRIDRECGSDGARIGTGCEVGVCSSRAGSKYQGARTRVGK